MSERHVCSGCGRSFSERGFRSHQSSNYVAMVCRPPRPPEEARAELVRIEYERILTAAILKHGMLVSKTASTFGWTGADEEYGSSWRGPRHSTECGIAKTGRVEEDSTWYEFAGTFASNDHYKHGMEVHGVTCNCGKITDRVYRWDASVGEAIRTVTMELVEERIEAAPKRRIREGCCGQELCIFDGRGFGQKGPCWELVAD